MDSVRTFFEKKTILITGGTGSFGHSFVKRLLVLSPTVKLLIYSRDEYKQYLMAQEYKVDVEKGRLKFIIGDVRNRERLMYACRGVDCIVHAAALKQVPACENNIEEAILTNITGALNVRCVAELCRVKKVVALSTDKAVQPVNLYGATKMVSDKVFTDMSNITDTTFCIVRYGNVASSRGSVIPLFLERYNSGLHDYPITDMRMTRFWIGLNDAVNMAINALVTSDGGETFVAKLPSFYITDLVKAIDPNGRTRVIGIRTGEKLDEMMITKYDAEKTVDFGAYYVIYPTIEKALNSGKQIVPLDFEYSSGNNTRWLNIEDIQKLL